MYQQEFCTLQQRWVLACEFGQNFRELPRHPLYTIHACPVAAWKEPRGLCLEGMSTFRFLAPTLAVLGISFCVVICSLESVEIEAVNHKVPCLFFLLLKPLSEFFHADQIWLGFQIPDTIGRSGYVVDSGWGWSIIPLVVCVCMPVYRPTHTVGLLRRPDDTSRNWFSLTLLSGNKTQALRRVQQAALCWALSLGLKGLQWDALLCVFKGPEDHSPLKNRSI